MEIYIYQAECGDAARLRYLGTDDKYHNIFIDSGFDRTFDHVLAKEIHKIKQGGESIDLWIISHIHDDHIGGVLEYKNSILYGHEKDIVGMWYYNPPRLSLTELDASNPVSISASKSIKQGDDLTDFIHKNGKLPLLDITAHLPMQEIFGLKIHVLSPSPSKLDRLRKKYSLTGYKMLERNELSSISEAKAAKDYDYRTLIENFNLIKWEEDKSIENGSSISVLTEFNGKIVLWLADSHPYDIITALRNLGYSESNPLICDYVKVSHHGSKGNNSDEMYGIIRCNNYIMSVDGENIHYLPNKECIARILRNSNRPEESHYNFYFTYDNQTLRSIFKADGEDVFERWKFTTYFLSGCEWIYLG